jgi:hypothetical protein
MSPRLTEPLIDAEGSASAIRPKAIDAEGSASAVRPKARETPVMTRSRTATQQDAIKIPANRKRKIDQSVLPTIVEGTRPKRTRRK